MDRRHMLTALMIVAPVLLMVAVSMGQGATGGEPVTWTGEPTAEEVVLLDQAEEILIGRCMMRQGIPYWVVPRSEPEALRKLHGFNYVIDDIAWAREYGFGGQLQRRLAQAKRDDPNQRYFQSLSPERRAAVAAALAGERPEGLSARLLTGQIMTASDRGCIAEAQGELYGDAREWFRVHVIASNLRPLSVPMVRADPRFRQALAQWATCMRRLGLPYGSPEDLRAAEPQRTAGLTAAEVRAEDVRLAVAEATCAGRTPLAATARELDRHYRAIVREQHGSEVEGERRLQRAALPRARQIVKDGPFSPNVDALAPRQGAA